VYKFAISSLSLDAFFAEGRLIQLFRLNKERRQKQGHAIDDENDTNRDHSTEKPAQNRTDHIGKLHGRLI